MNDEHDHRNNSSPDNNDDVKLKLKQRKIEPISSHSNLKMSPPHFPNRNDRSSPSKYNNTLPNKSTSNTKTKPRKEYKSNSDIKMKNNTRTARRVSLSPSKVLRNPSPNYWEIVIILMVWFKRL